MSWSLSCISDCVEKVTTWNPSKSETQDPFLYIDLSALDKDKKVVNRNSITEVAPREAPSRARQLVRSGDVLVATVRPNLNGVAMVPEEYEGATASTGYCVLRADVKNLDSQYLYYWVQANTFVTDMMEKATGANYPAVSDKIIKESKIPLPPLAEQKRIAAILDKADAIRRKRQQAIQLADEFLRSVFLDMFGPCADRSEWEKVTFSEVLLIDAPMVDPRESKYLDLVHIGPDRIEKNTGKLLPAHTAREERLISKKFLFNKSYVLYSKIRPYLRKVAIPNFTGLCSADMYPVRPRDSLLTREYLWQLLLSDEFTQYTETLPGRANIPKLNRNELANFTFKIPPIALQKKFSKIFEKHNKFLSVSNSAKNVSKISFDALSQKAFRGEL